MKKGTADMSNLLNGMKRRSVLKGMGGMGLAAAGAGFLGMPRRASAAESLNYMCWEGYNAPSILEPFQKAKDTTISIDLITDSAGGFAKLAAGASRDFDLVSSDSPWIQRMGPAGFCRFLDDKDFAEQYGEFYPQFRAPFAPLQFEGKATGLPTRWGWVGPTVNTKFDKLESWSSYAPVFDSAYKDKICLLDWGDWPIMPLALYAGVNPYEELDEAALGEVRKVLRAAFKNTRAIVADLAVAQKGLLDGSFRALIGGGTYCTSSLRLKGHDYIQSIVPEPKNGLKQGIIWMEATGLVDNGKNSEIAADFLKYIVSPEVAKQLAITEATCNLVPNQKAEALFSEEEKKALQMDYMWTAWDNSQFHTVAPNIDDMLAIWQEELAAR
ncbi:MULTISPECIES: ABC transporter substrate-binding protein [Alphaproteobacteria]|uniref:Spermidine/putrescine ABC transporter substrate-binding protein n=2 Tax=Alphaproteobacteria TaxID=28211 RepID=A0A512HKZ8_9HYPH|nr:MULTISPECIES: PotD/PotF family extracellular solute-binding protein [Alphaproteobacteria]GEO86119.1 spermidine/putrescine ABC transporter substrate-binding protein [Ciceribacter naphthalenivorans]GLR22686.1 spermidine/putrescine ABC transporter substrate-binding protein [Ciceribacter naphthalenivorans]GLT05542.1 spermidine/putrescine ABC transporter substrate-binding protein [Sphingomonas psychrolutea]